MAPAALNLHGESQWVSIGASSDSKQAVSQSIMEHECKMLPIAIVGMSFRGPADANNVENLWKLVAEKREGWSPIPKERWNNEAFYHPDNARFGTTNVKGGHFFSEDLALFDAPFFNMSSAEAAVAFGRNFQCAREWSAARAPTRSWLTVLAGMPLEKVVGTKTSCFVGSFSGDYTDMLVRDPDCTPMYQCTNAGQSRAITANRVSYYFDLKGPSVTVDTACSGSLVALHLACQSLRSGDAEMAVAAGVNTILNHEFMNTMSMMKFLSPDGRCYTFDERANGYARGEGVGCLILKPLHTALRDNDSIRAVIRGSGSNQDGRTSGITLPSAISQEALIRDVYAAAGLSPLETEYVEAHGTGTQAGDPLETSALSKVFCDQRSADNPLRIGSIKTNIGHLEGASGIAGVVKAVLMLERRLFLPQRNFKIVNPRIPLKDWKLKVQLDLEPWCSEQPHRISVNSFGYGGSNAHIVLEDAEGFILRQNLKKAESPHRSENLGGACKNGYTNGDISHVKRLFVLSSFDESAGKQYATTLSQHIREKQLDDEQFIQNFAFTLNERRSKFNWRSVVRGDSSVSLANSLNEARFARVSKVPTVAFVFTGQGAQWCGMGGELLHRYRVFSETIDRIGKFLRTKGAPFDVRSEMTKNPEDSQINSALYSQPMCTALQIALINLLESWAIRPASVTGHSSGEIAAAYAMGALSEEDAMAVSYYRGVCSAHMRGHDQSRGAMMAVGMASREAQQLVDSLVEGKATVACINSPSSVTISGDTSAIDELKAILDEKRIFAKRLAVDVAYHSHHMERVADKYLDSMAEIHPREGRQDVTFFSSVTGAQALASQLGREYWSSNMRGQVKFADSLKNLCLETTSIEARKKQRKVKKRIGAAVKASVDLLVEIGPHSALAGPIKQVLKADEALNAGSITYTSALVRNSDAVDTALDLVTALIMAGYPVDLSSVNHMDSISFRPLVNLPPYPWNHSKAYWAESRISKAYRNRKYPRTDLLGSPDHHANPMEPRWRNHIRSTEIPWVLDHKIQSNIVYPAAGYIIMAIEAISQLSQDDTQGYILRNISIGAALVLDEQHASEVMVSLKPRYGTWHEFSVYSASDDDRWTEHATGLIQTQQRVSPNEVTGSREIAADANAIHVRMSDAIAQCGTCIDPGDFYRKLATLGLEYGDTFSNLTKVRVADNLCIGEVTIPDSAAIMPAKFEYPYFIHPCVLDSIFHPIFAALFEAGFYEPAVPISIGELKISKQLNTNVGQQIEVCATTERHGLGDIKASIWGRNLTENSFGLSIKDLSCRILAKESEMTSQEIPHLAFGFEWRPDPDLISLEYLLGSTANPTPTELELQILRDCEAGAQHYISKALPNLDMKVLVNKEPHQQKQWSYLAQASKRIPNKTKDGLFLERLRASGPEGALVCAIGENLSEIFENNVDPVQLMTEQGRLEAFWNESPRFLRTYEALSQYIDLLGHQNPFLSILEIGAETGGATLPILERLTGSDIPRLKRYTYTIPDGSMFAAAAARFAQWAELITIKELDLDGEFEDQGFSQNGYDVVIVSHGLYGRTKSIHQALCKMRKLLKSSGNLVLIDPTPSEESLARSMVVGFRQSWWGDNVEPTSTRHGLSEKEWHAKLLNAHFAGIDLSIPNGGNQGYEGCMMIAHAAQEPLPAADLLVVADGSAVLVAELQDTLVPWNIEVSTFADASPYGRICIVLSDLKTPMLADADAHVFDMAKRLFLEATGVLWVTQGGTAPSPQPNANLITGFARTARSELGGSAIVTLDLDAENPSPPDVCARLIASVFAKVFEKQGLMKDFEYRERNGQLLIPRLVPSNVTNQSISASLSDPVPLPQPFFQLNRPLRAVVEEQIYFAEFAQRDLADDEIRIEVRASNIIGGVVSEPGVRRPQVQLGTQCSGIICAVGCGITDFVIGDKVCCLGKGTLASYYQDTVSSFQKIPIDLSFEEAAAFPVPYFTAYFAVYHLARVSRTACVFINGAGGPIGQALLQFCKLIGAKIYAAVHSSVEKDLLMKKWKIPEEFILYSGDSSFAKGLRHIPDQVEIIFNLLASSEAIRLSWDILAPYGHLIELSGQNLELQLIKEATYSSFNISSFIHHKRNLASRIFGDLICLLRAGAIECASPVVYPITDLDKALEATNPDTIVVSADHDSHVLAVPKDRSSELLSPSVSYLLVGGLGGIGRATATWMIDHGARNLIFANRSGLARPAAKETADALEAHGAKVVVYACDVSDEREVFRMTQKAAQEMPPIKGVIQGAMVLRDALIEHLTVEDFHAVLYPKLRGTWNLHQFLPKDMDFFIMESSISGIIGNATQAAYAAGSTFMDAFAAYRNVLGLPAVTLDLGVITGVGYLAENAELAAGMERQGFEGTDQRTLMALIESAIVEPRRKGTHAQVVTGLGTWKEGRSLGNFDAPLFSHFRRAAMSSSSSPEMAETAHDARRQLMAATTLTEAAASVSACLAERIAARLQVPAAEVSHARPVSEYGVDSLVAVEMRNWAAKELKSTVPILEILANVSLQQLASKIASRSELVQLAAADA